MEPVGGPLVGASNVKPFPRPPSESSDEIESIDYNSEAFNTEPFPRPPSETPESAKPEPYVPPPHSTANYLELDVALRVLLLATTLVSVIVICSVYHKYSRHFGTSIALSLVAAIQLILLAWLSVYTLSKRIPKQAN